MIIRDPSPFIRMTKAPPGFRDPIYEKPKTVKVATQVISSTASGNSHAVADSSLKAKVSEAELIKGLEHLSLDKG